MTESNKTKRTGTNMFYVWIQEESPNKFFSINQQDKTLEDLENDGKVTSEMEQAMTAFLEVDDDDVN
jgi:uridine phosphorylase